MKYLFDSKGQHIANLVNGQLHAPTGQNIGHFMPSLGIFIDRKGYYLGEMVKENRLLYRVNHPYQHVCYGSYGDYGNVGNYGNPGNYGSIGQIPGFRDIEKSRLQLS